MRKYREPANRHQQSLLPRSIDEYVSERDFVRSLDVLVDELDLSAIDSKYSVIGRRGYDPRVLLKILFYGKIRGIRSSRELARACQENLKFMYLAGHEEPDFRTISTFRKENHKELASLLRQTIRIGVEHKVIKLEHVSIDGTRVGASAGRNSFKDPEKLKTILSEVEARLCESFAKDIELDDSEDETHDDSDGSGGLPDSVEDLESLRKKLKAAVAHYDEIEDPSKRPKKISVTDPECRYMKTKGINPAYSGLAAVDRDSRMVVAGYATNAVSDNAELKPCLEQIEENTGNNPCQVTADKGFRAHNGLVELQEREIDGYVPPPEPNSKKFSVKDFQYDPKTDSYTCPNGKVLNYKTILKREHTKFRKYICEQCGSCPLIAQCLQPKAKRRHLYVSVHQILVERMFEKTSSEIGKQMAKIRVSTVEPLFGYLKAAKKLRQFLFRGINMINSMWQFELAAYNIEQLAKLQQTGKLQLQNS